MAKALMIQGTASGVGKTVITTALCRIFKQDGYKVSPFKAQNMTANTAFTKGGNGAEGAGEMAISQLLQAYAAGVEPSADMSPVVLKPSPEKTGTQVILNGSYYVTIDAYNFKEIKKNLVPEIMRAYNNLSRQYDIIVIEGAGSPVELNLTKRSGDIVNMGMAKRVSAPVLMVADIDRGGVFASLHGTLGLLDESEREYVKATIINRFKGEIAYFAEGVQILEEITGLPVAGVVPYIQFELPEEDGLYNDTGAICVSDNNFDRQFDLIAAHVRQSLDMDLIYNIINGGVENNYE